MKAVDSNFLELLKKSGQFIVPIYQRVYSWGRDECEQLWKDVEQAGANDRLGAHFTGSIVYVSKGNSTNTSSEPDLIIDGQQRVTTLSLLLAALALRLEELPEGKQEVHDGFSPKKIRNRWLIDDDEDGDRRFKLLLSQQDREALKAAVQGFRMPENSSSRVVPNFEYFRAKLARTDCDLVTICKGLEKLVVVDVKLERGVDNPQLVFEAMNSTGKKLSQADLIRNYVLMDLEPREQTHLYEQEWRPMELRFPNEDDWHFDSFVRHYLTIKTGTIPRLDDVYESFKGYTSRQILRGETIDGLVVDLGDFARRYQAIALGAERDPELRTLFRELDQIKADVVYPFLLEIYQDFELQILNKADFLQLLALVVSYVFRRAVCKIPTNSLNKTFAGLSSSIRKDRYLESAKAVFLNLQSYRRFPSDEEFQEALVTSDLYHFRRRTYFFRKLENAGRKEPVSVEEYTIEHIMPQNPELSPEWQADLGPEWQSIQEEYLHTLGNLTLTGYNSEYSDHAFTRKRDMVGGFAQSPLRLNRDVGQLPAWDDSAIQNRAQRLAEESIRIWPRPSLRPEAMSQYLEVRSLDKYDINDHPNLMEPRRRELFERLSQSIFELDPAVTREYLKLYVAFKLETNFVDVIPQKARMLLSLSIPAEALVDPREMARDVTGLGRWGTGTVEVPMNEDSDFDYLIGLVRQAYEFQLDED